MFYLELKKTKVTKRGVTSSILTGSEEAMARPIIEADSAVLKSIWHLTPEAVRLSVPIRPPIRGRDRPCRGGEGFWGKLHAAVGDSCSLPSALPRDRGLMGPRGSICRPRPGTTQDKYFTKESTNT